MAAPVVDRLERNLQGRAQVVRLETRHPVSAELADLFQVRAVPSLLVFNGSGKIIYRGVGIPNPEQVERLVFKLKRSHFNR
jgi:thioredoxin-related protein